MNRCCSRRTRRSARDIELTERPGSRPRVSTDGPQTQLDQRSSPALWGELVAALVALPGVVEGISAVSPVSSRALFLDELRVVVVPETSLAPHDRLEPAHVHGVHDTSVHLCLPTERAAEVCRLGWAEPHQYGDFGTEILVYGPRDRGELDVVVSLVAESLAFARSVNAGSHPQPR